MRIPAPVLASVLGCLAFAALAAPIAHAAVATASAPAARAGEEVEVAGVKFTPNLRAASGAGWLEAAVALDVRPATTAPGRMVSRVRVALLLHFEVAAGAGAPKRSEYYRAEAECVALEAGRAEVRFYLPPELVKRDQLAGEPRAWGVELAVGGRTVAAARGAYPAALATAEARKNFQARGATAAAANDGLLLPQFLTPFFGDYPRATPTFVRREMR
jgi:hypothetical protein